MAGLCAAHGAKISCPPRHASFILALQKHFLERAAATAPARISEQYQSALKKKAKEVNAAKNKKFITDAAKRIDRYHALAVQQRAEAAKAVA